jgi:hypothetical protein
MDNVTNIGNQTFTARVDELARFFTALKIIDGSGDAWTIKAQSLYAVSGFSADNYNLGETYRTPVEATHALLKVIPDVVRATTRAA